MNTPALAAASLPESDDTPVPPVPFEVDLWRHRRLLASFVRRDLRLRYAGSALGAAWAIIHPLTVLALYIVVFSTLVRGGGFAVHGRVAGYALFLCPALLAWNWTLESLIGACGSVTGNGMLIKKLVFPSAILPLAPVASGLLPFGASMAAFLIYAALTAGLSFKAMLWLPVLVVLQAALLAGLAYGLATLNVFLRDTQQMVTAGLQFVFWATPIVYTPESLTGPYPWTATWFQLNPMAWLVSAYRDVLVAGQAPDRVGLAYVAMVATVAYHVGRTMFLRGRKHFADEV